ncbi:MAG: DUF308 domain-containing protein [Bacteroidales bacterium]|nr:DUF308 domain-containing protein [Candidatus Cacconaster merdequi]
MATNIAKQNLVRAVVAFCLGLLLVIWPDFMARSIVQIVGIAALVWGVMSVILFFKDKATSTLIEGIVGVIAGILLLFKASLILKYIFIILAIVLIVFAVEQVVSLIKAKAAWKSFLLPAVTVVLGIIILCNPSGSKTLIFVLTGIALLVYAVSGFITAMKLRK